MVEKVQFFYNGLDDCLHQSPKYDNYVHLQRREIRRRSSIER